jgi:hypothetical protein
MRSTAAFLDSVVRGFASWDLALDRMKQAMIRRRGYRRVMVSILHVLMGKWPEGLWSLGRQKYVLVAKDLVEP